MKEDKDIIRISKHGDVRKKEFLDTSLELFYKKGYDNTSINDIIKEIGVSKGAFYYYFKSKEEILDSLSISHVQSLIHIYEKVLRDTKLNALEKLNKMIALTQDYHIKNVDYYAKSSRILGSYENLKLTYKINQKIIEMVVPVLTEVIKQGINQDIFDTPYPEDAAQVYMHIKGYVMENISMLSRNLDNEPDNLEKINSKLAFFEDTVNRLLGIRKGSVKIAEHVLRGFEALEVHMKKLEKPEK